MRESLFGALGDDRLAGTGVLDLFAGSGALAIEALSRGAARAVLVEHERAAIEAIVANLETTGFHGQARVEQTTVRAFLRAGVPGEAPFRLVFLDPPYSLPAGEVAEVLSSLAEPGWLTDEACVVLERAASSSAPLLPESWGIAWQRTYGDTLVAVAVADT